jgi:nitroreductase
VAQTPGFFDVALHQRATRQFADRDVPDELVERVLAVATHAPSAENRQPWVFVVIRDAEIRATVAELTRRSWRDGARQHSEGRLSPELLADVDQGAETGMAGAPVIVVVCGDARLGLAITLPSSVYLATQNLLLAASALGLGSAMTTLATRYDAELRELLALPAEVVPMAVVPLGWPLKVPGPPRRLPVATRAYRDRFGEAW